MTVRPYKTPPVIPGTKLTDLLDANLPELKEESIVVVTSKIVAICEGRMIKNDGTVTKDELVKKESGQWVSKSLGEYQVYLTIKNDTLIANAGIDESNADGNFILWPADPAKAAEEIWNHLRTSRNLTHIGVLLTDSYLAPMRWGTRGFGLAWCGFAPLKNYIGEPDIFGRPLHMTQASMLDGFAAAAVVAMGEGNEQTPLAVIEDIPFVTWHNEPPSESERAKLRIKPEDDLYSPVLTAAPWVKGGTTA